MRTLLYLSPSFGGYSISTTIARQYDGGINRRSGMTRKHAKEPETVRLSSNEGNNMKGARRRIPVRTKRIIRLTLIASAFYAVFAARTALAQASQSPNRNLSAFDRPDSSLSSTSSLSSSSASRYSNPEGETSDFNSQQPRKRFDGRFMRAQHRMQKPLTGNRDQQAVQPIPLPPDPPPPERPPRHAVMTADERRLLRQHIEEAVRDLYKR